MNVNYNPSTTIKLYAGVPWDSTNVNIRWYPLGQTCENEIQQFLVQELTKYTVVKNESTSGTFRIETPFTDISQCNYCSFQNNIGGTSNRTIFAFITDINYINLNCTEVSYSIDLISTWMDVMDIGECWVEREHVSTADDVPGAYTEKESVDTGEFVRNAYEDFTVDCEPILYYMDENLTTKTINGIFSGCNYTMSESDVVNKLNELSAQPERIAMLIMAPKDALNNISQKYETTLTMSIPTQLDGYTPVNKKLLTYPYMFLYVGNFLGDNQELHWEEFGGDTSVQFYIEEISAPKPCMELRPYNYKEYRVSSTGNADFSIYYDDFPVCTYPMDSYETWVSMYNKRTAANAVISIGSTVANAALGVANATKPGQSSGIAGAAAISSATEAVSTIVNAQFDKEEYALHSASIAGSVEMSGMNFADGRVGFMLEGQSIKADRAEKIDAYFGTYGYSANTQKYPNTQTRAYFNFLKTSGCIVTGSAPDIAKRALATACDNGVFLWHTIEIGRHSWRENV